MREICKNKEMCSRGDKENAPVPHVGTSNGPWGGWESQNNSRAAGSLKSRFSGNGHFFSLDTKIDARFVIYVKNRPRGVFGRSLTSEKCMF